MRDMNTTTTTNHRHDPRIAVTIIGLAIMLALGMFLAAHHLMPMWPLLAPITGIGLSIGMLRADAADRKARARRKAMEQHPSRKGFAS